MLSAEKSHEWEEKTSLRVNFSPRSDVWPAFVISRIVITFIQRFFRCFLGRTPSTRPSPVQRFIIGNISLPLTIELETARMSCTKDPEWKFSFLVSGFTKKETRIKNYMKRIFDYEWNFYDWRGGWNTFEADYRWSWSRSVACLHVYSAFSGIANRWSFETNT